MLIYLNEGLRFYKHRIHVARYGYKQYDGSAEEILKQIIEECWNGSFFQTSAGHYNQFWMRDFGLCAEHLISLGHREKVRKTLKYALEIFNEHNRVTTTITPDGKPFDFPCYAPDSIAYLTKCLFLLNDKALLRKYWYFLNQQVKEYFSAVVEKSTGLVKRNKHFSSMKDYSIRSSSCYNNCMTAMLKENVTQLGLYDPFADFNYPKLIKKHFWNRDHFVDDLRSRTATGDANVFPFYCSVFDNRRMYEQCLFKIRQQDLDKPFPLRYFNRKAKEHNMIFWLDILSRGWEHHNVWPNLALPFLVVLKRFKDPLLKKYLAQYRDLIEKHKNLLEVFTPQGKPFKTLLYCADEGMLWSAVLLDLMRK